MTLIIGARCRDGVVLAADRRRLARYEKGPDTNKLFKLACSAVLAGAGDEAVLNEARLFIDQRIGEFEPQPSLFDIVEITSRVVNELVSIYKERVEESFGYVLGGLEDLSSGSAKLYTIFGAGFSDVPWACLGSGSSYARPLVKLLLAEGNLSTEEAAKTMLPIFSLVSNVQTTVGDGVDVCVVKDNQGVQAITHQGEVSLDGIRTAILNTIGVKSL